jgi:hypothetical protein
MKHTGSGQGVAVILDNLDLQHENTVHKRAPVVDSQRLALQHNAVHTGLYDPFLI